MQKERKAIDKWVVECIKTDYHKFYKSYIWKKFRSKIMLERKGRCEICWNGGKDGKGVRRYKKATTLHHKKHLKQFPQLALDRDNVILVCDECHKEEHPEIYAKTHKITEERWD